MILFLKRLASPQFCYTFSSRVIPWLGISCIGFLIYGLLGGLYLSPPDYQQGDAMRILYIHVPCAILSLMIYTFLFFQSVIFLIFRLKIADGLAAVSAPIGALYTLIALITGAIWGKPMWGTWWIWDARLTSELILLFLYLGYIGLRSAIIDRHTQAKACAVLAIVGMVDVPIVHFSVEWWATLHQGASLSKFSKPSISTPMLYPLLAMLAAFALFYVTFVLIRLQSHLLSREQDTEWVQKTIKSCQG